MSRFFILIYSVATYFLFFGVFLYLIAFVMGLPVPTTVDEGMGHYGWIGNVAWIALFGVQHTIMARARFKQWWTKFVPEAAERTTFVLIASLILVGLFRFWSPVPGHVWEIESEAARVVLYALSALGWGTALLSTFLINHFDLFGLRQAYLHFSGKPYTQVQFKEALFYKHIRHPLMLGFLVAFWSTPSMSAGHFLFSATMSLYVLVGILFEERELISIHGSAYEVYAARTGKLLPRFGLRSPN
ncbi:MAG: isoprenylcysteine carboxylmethyltransferase family protein [Bdellovibrionota bacterium]